MTRHPTMLGRALALAAASAAPFAAAHAQTFTTIAAEDFDDYRAGEGLGGQSGGSFWQNDWLSGVGGTNAVVTAPGLDGSANKATTNADGASSFRIPKAEPFADTIAPAQIGVDGATLFFSFTARRIAGGDDTYGGLSLTHVGRPGELLLGSPVGSLEWGATSPDGVSGTVAGSNVDAVTRLVFRIDYVPGDEQLSLFLDPTTPHPDPAVTTPDLGMIVEDHQWDQIRLASGGGALTGYHLDDIRIECQDCDPPSLKADIQQIALSAGGTQVLTLQAGAANELKPYLLAGSVSGQEPGIPLPPASTVPLSYDAYTQFTVVSPNTPPLAGSLALLDPNGKGTASFTLSPGSDPGLAGATVHHAYVVIDVTAPFGIDFVSDAVLCELVP